MTNDDIDDNEDDIYISDQTRSMRRACEYCIKLFHQLEAKDAIASVNANTNTNTNRRYLRSIFREGHCRNIDNLRVASREHRTRRKDAHHAFWSSVLPKSSGLASDDSASDSALQITKPIPIEKLQVRMTLDGNGNIDSTLQTICPDQVRSFKDRFQNRNVPCLITGLDSSGNFRFVNQRWRKGSGDGAIDSATNCVESIPSKPLSSKINREWFRDELGDDCQVPLRYNPQSGVRGDSDSGSQLSLDEDGRAMECETKEVSIKEWIHLLEVSQEKRKDSGGGAINVRCNSEGQHGVHEGEPNKIIYYLKDWHLQQRYSSAAQGSPERDSLSPRNEEDSLVANLDSGSCSLYTVPEFFGHDLLNSFLKRFTTGDYRFCYWGPSRSFTARHSDVLHSFSWSYNVLGTKEWTFYYSDHVSGNHNHNRDIDARESKNDDGLCHGDKTFTIIQETGQTIFVPAMWQHKVVNLEETISINHNWITSSNLDLVWDCLVVEMVAIQNELKGWDCGNSNNDDAAGLDQNTEACENMLRGCIGLDVTGFVLMTLVGLLEAATALLSMPLSNAETVSSRDNSQLEVIENHGIRKTKEDEHLFDALRLTSVLQDVLATEEHIVRLRSRLSAVLQSDEMAESVENMVTDLIAWIQIN